MQVLRILVLCLSAALICMTLRAAHPQMAAAVAMAAGVAALMLSSADLVAFSRALRTLLTKLPEEYPLPPPSIEITGLTLEKLAKAFRKVLERAEAAERSENMAQREIRRDSFTVAGCMVRISRRLKSGSCRFSEFFAEDYSREEVITMFLAILELARLSRLHIEQADPYEEIRLSA